MDRRRVAELFEQALDLPPGESGDWLTAACAGDETLRAQVERLLRADARAQGFLERPPREACAVIDAVAGDVPHRLGAYRVLHRIGAGGMGEVWLAERSDGEFEQRVAIKQVAYPTPGLLHRFRQERQILARLEHPGIARLIDGGVGDDGAPYLVMEYVEGVPITAFARARALDVRARLRLFLRVCEAVQFAHQNLVVHRDLKPSNIFVAADGAPKLLDFGIAKVLAATDADAPTRTAAAMLTPDYAAPEQLAGAPATTAVDIYALGIVLYELLSDARPLRPTSDGVAREPVPPSLAIGRASSVARRRELRGDLDSIATTALAHDPARRYPTAEALAADIQRYLEGRPIAARSGGAWYRFIKFAHRNRYALAAALLVVVVSVTAALVSLRQARLAREQAARAEAAHSFLVGIFDHADPDRSQDRPLTAQELLEKGEAQLSVENAHPAITADMTGLLGGLYWTIGDYERAQPLLERAVALSESTAVPDDVRARNLVRLARSESHRSLYAPAAEHAERAIALAERAAAVAEASDARRLHAQILTVRGDASLAEPIARMLLADDTARHGADSREAGEDWALLAHALIELSRYDEAIAAGREALRINRMRIGERSTVVATGLNDLGFALTRKGDYVGAERTFQQALEIKVERYGEHHRATLSARANLLMAQEKQGRYEEGLEGRLTLLADLERVLGERHADEIARAHNMIGLDYLMLGRFAEAEASFRQALSIWTAMAGASEEARIGPLGNLAIALQLKGDYAQAEATLRETLAIGRRAYPPDSEWLNQDRGFLGNLLRLQHRHAEALDELRAAAAAVEGAGHGPSPVVAQLYSQLAEAELDAGNAARAESRAALALGIARQALPPNNSGLGNPLFALARAKLALGQAGEAEPLLREALTVRSPFAANDPRTLEIKVALINTFEALGRRPEARALRAEIEPAMVALNSPYGADLTERLAER